MVLKHESLVGVAMGLSLALGGCSGTSSGSGEPSESVETAQEALGSGDCASVTLGIAPASTGSVGDVVTLTGSATCSSGPPEYVFWVNTPDGWIAPCGAYSPSATCDWDTTGLPPGSGYDIQVWTQAQGSAPPLGYESVAIYGGYTLAEAGCFAVTLATSPVGTAASGQTVTLTGDATCTNAEYVFWVNTPNGWIAPCGAYSPSATCEWDTTGLPPGSGYDIQVWTQAQGSDPPLGYESVAIHGAYTLAAPGCYAVTLTTSSVDSAPTGQTVTLTGDAACSAGTPEYIFYVKTPDGWIAPCGGYSPNATCDWDTTGLPPGSDYDIQVWTREQGTTPALGYDSVAIKGGYQLSPVGASCPSVTLTTGPADVAQVGQSVTLTGSAACDVGTPEYVFYVRTPAGWIAPCGGYSTNAICTWDTTGLPESGSYDIQVWTRAQNTSPPAGYDSVAIFAAYELVGASDACPGAFTPIAAGGSVDIGTVAEPAETNGYTNAFDHYTCSGLTDEGAAPDRVFHVKPSSAGTLTIELRNVGSNGGFDGMLGVWTGSCSAPDESAAGFVACEDDALGDVAWTDDHTQKEQVVMTVAANEDVFVVVDGWSVDSYGEFMLHMDLTP